MRPFIASPLWMAFDSGFMLALALESALRGREWLALWSLFNAVLFTAVAISRSRDERRKLTVACRLVGVTLQ